MDDNSIAVKYHLDIILFLTCNLCKTTLTTSSNLLQGRLNYNVFVMSPGSLIRSDDLLFLKHFYSIQSNAIYSRYIDTNSYNNVPARSGAISVLHTVSTNLSHQKAPSYSITKLIY